MKHGSIGGLTLLGTFGLRVRVHLIERCVFVCVCVCVGQDLTLYLARTRDTESDGGVRGQGLKRQARCHSC